jgi:NAD(P)-dependent dehydrogenase (short-subunit alcohol dehydrogenase family)
MTKNEKAALAFASAGVSLALAARAMKWVRTIDFRDRSVLITGGSRGLGLLIARELAAEGAALTLVARDQQELDRASDDLASRSRHVLTITCDVRDREEASNAIQTAVHHYGRLDVLINDAGVIQVGPVAHMTLQDFEDAMGVHFWGPLYMMLAAIPHMRGLGDARIVNISSIGGKIGVPHLVPYCASKFALVGLSDAIRPELARDGIRVTTVCPGLMRTGSPFNAWFKGQHRHEFTWFAISDSLPLLSVDGTRAARQVIEACRTGQAELIITPQARLAVILNALFPNQIAYAMELVTRVLPGPTGPEGDEARSGWQSPSALAPSILTRLTERAAAANNELRG